MWSDDDVMNICAYARALRYSARPMGSATCGRTSFIYAQRRVAPPVPAEMHSADINLMISRILILFLLTPSPSMYCDDDIMRKNLFLCEHAHACYVITERLASISFPQWHLLVTLTSYQGCWRKPKLSRKNLRWWKHVRKIKTAETT